MRDFNGDMRVAPQIVFEFRENVTYETDLWLKSERIKKILHKIYTKMGEGERCEG